MSEAPKTDHAYDGIEEYDNPLPPWWKWLFAATVAFAPVYWVFYHGGAPGRSIEDKFEIALAANTRLQFDELGGDLKPDAETITKFMAKQNWVDVGKSVFRTNCISCHGQNAEGKVGPNLTDDSYKNVVKIEDIARVVSEGAGAGAMPKWSNRLHINEVVLVSAYVASLRGTDAKDGKAAEGKKIAPWPDPPPEEAEEEESSKDE